MIRKSYVVYIDFPNKLVGSTWLGKVFMDGKGRMNDFVKDGLLPVGHSGVLYIDGDHETINYSEFGRFDDREGHFDVNGRIIIRKKKDEHFHGVTGVTRSSLTNPEILDFDIKPKYQNTELTNLNDILRELRNRDCFFNTHKDVFITPYDVMVGGVLEVKPGKIQGLAKYVKKMEGRGSMYYGAPHKMYCSKYARHVVRMAGYKIPWYVFRGISTIDFLVKKYGSKVIHIHPDEEREKETEKIFEYHYDILLKDQNLRMAKRFKYVGKDKDQGSS